VGAVEKHFLKIKAISIRKAISTGRPLATERFIKDLRKLLSVIFYPRRQEGHKRKVKKYGKCPSYK